MGTPLWYSNLLVPALPAAGGLFCCLALLVLWRRSQETHLLFWMAACITQGFAVGTGFFYQRNGGPAWLAFCGLMVAATVALIVMATKLSAEWLDRQNLRVRILAGEMERLRSQGLHDADMDRLTGLLNQSALAKRTERRDEFHGVVVVCDMDNFKEINDQFGHLVGDEILRNVGQLVRASIRVQDQAFRWGGDEFVVVFHNQDQEMAHRRMQDVARRLDAFQVRGHGLVPLSFSWGIAEGHGQTLREALDKADHEMYSYKRRHVRRPAGEAAGAKESTSS